LASEVLSAVVVIVGPSVNPWSDDSGAGVSVAGDELALSGCREEELDVGGTLDGGGGTLIGLPTSSRGGADAVDDLFESRLLPFFENLFRAEASLPMVGKPGEGRRGSWKREGEEEYAPDFDERCTKKKRKAVCATFFEGELKFLAC